MTPNFDITTLRGKKLLRFAIELCDVIAADAGAGNARGGIFPGNLSCTEDGKLALGPAAKSNWQGEELQFIAPEEYWDGKATAASDVYSVGLLLYYAVSQGHLPFDEDEDGGQARRMSGENFAMPEALKGRLGEIVAKATALKPSERYESVGALKAMVESCLDNRYFGGEKASAQGLFNKEEHALSDMEKMMLAIVSSADAEEESEPSEMEKQPIEEKTPAEESPVEPAPAEEPTEEETTPAESEIPAQTSTETTAEEEAPAEREESPTEDLPEQESSAEETPVEEAHAEESHAAETTVAPVVPGDEDVKIVGEKRERVPILTVEENPELTPVTPKRPNVQYKKSVEREKKISKKVRQHRQRSGIIVVALCVALIMVAYLYNGVVNGSWGSLTKDTAPEATPVAEEASVAPIPTQEITPEPEPTPEPEHHYEIVASDDGWLEAQDACAARGGYLAVISNEEEFNTVTRAAEEAGVYRLWIGCRRLGGELTWLNDESSDYYPWDYGEPSYIDDGDGAAEDYIMLWYNDGRWCYNDSREDPAGEFWNWRGTLGYVLEYVG